MQGKWEGEGVGDVKENVEWYGRELGGADCIEESGGGMVGGSER